MLIFFDVTLPAAPRPVLKSLRKRPEGPPGSFQMLSGRLSANIALFPDEGIYSSSGSSLFRKRSDPTTGIETYCRLS